MFQEIIEKLCPEENGLCVRARRAREELVFLPLSQMYGYEAPRKHIEALLSFSDAIGLQLARDFFGNGLMIGFNSAFDGRHFDFEVRGARLYVRGKEAAGGRIRKEQAGDPFTAFRSPGRRLRFLRGYRRAVRAISGYMGQEGRGSKKLCLCRAQRRHSTRGGVGERIAVLCRQSARLRKRRKIRSRFVPLRAEERLKIAYLQKERKGEPPPLFL